MSSPTLADLVVRTRAGDREAWGDLTGRYVGMVQAICDCYRLTGDDAAEVSQVTWLRLAEGLAHVRRPDAIGGWLAAVARSHCLRVRRTTGGIVTPIGDAAAAADAQVTVSGGEAARRRHGVAGGGRAGVSSEGGLDPRLARSERERALLAGLAALEVPCQRLVRLLVVEPPLSPDEIGPALDLPVGEVTPAGRRCLDGLRAALGDRSLDDAALLEELRQVVASTGPEPRVEDQAALRCTAWLASDAQLAELAYDSIVGAGRPSSARGLASGHRALSYTIGARSVHLGLAVSADQVVLQGDVQPADRVPLMALTPGGQVETETRDDGTFRIDELPRRPLSVIVGGARPFKTGWIVL